MSTSLQLNVNECPIFISSADSYSDLWPLFFQIFRREWPSYKGIIYLNTEVKGFSYPGLNIVCTKTGRQRHFGETFFAGIDSVPNDHFLLMCIDYFFEGRADIAMLQRIYTAFCTLKPDSVRLITHPFRNREQIDGVPECYRIKPPCASCSWFSLQMAFWSKAAIHKFIKPWEDPWQSEHFGSRRALRMNPNIWNVFEMPIKYDAAGVLHGGRWYEVAVRKIDFSGLDVDFTKRGYYNDRHSWLYRKLKIQFLKRYLGSWANFCCHIRSMWSVLNDVNC